MERLVVPGTGWHVLESSLTALFFRHENAKYRVVITSSSPSPVFGCNGGLASYRRQTRERSSEVACFPLRLFFAGNFGVRKFSLPTPPSRLPSPLWKPQHVRMYIWKVWMCAARLGVRGQGSGNSQCEADSPFRAAAGVVI